LLAWLPNLFALFTKFWTASTLGPFKRLQKHSARNDWLCRLMLTSCAGGLGLKVAGEFQGIPGKPRNFRDRIE
jgi:hypothetical protein